MRTFPNFGKELKRPFTVHETCYDCAEFYDGCGAWPTEKTFACATYNRLPDVLPGSCGQIFPESAKTGPTDRNRPCQCGRPLPKHKHLCEICRQQRRRQTKRIYQRNYMKARRAR